MVYQSGSERNVALDCKVDVDEEMIQQVFSDRQVGENRDLPQVRRNFKFDTELQIAIRKQCTDYPVVELRFQYQSQRQGAR